MTKIRFALWDLQTKTTRKAYAAHDVVIRRCDIQVFMWSCSWHHIGTFWSIDKQCRDRVVNLCTIWLGAHCLSCTHKDHDLMITVRGARAVRANDAHALNVHKAVIR